MKRLTKPTQTPDKAGSRATSIAPAQYSTNIAGCGAETGDEDRRQGCVSLVPTVEFNYPDEGDEPALRVRDGWKESPLLEKCSLQRFAAVPSGDLMTMPLLDKRLEVLRYALREAVEQMDLSTIHRLAEKALATAGRIATERLAAATPGRSERHEEIVIIDDAERGRVLVQFSDRVDDRTRRTLRVYGFNGSGDDITYWRRRVFVRGENMALNRARTLVKRLLSERAKLTAAQPCCA